MLDRGGKVDFEVFRSLRRSRVRTEVLMYLYKIYPEASYPAEIARGTGIDPSNVLGGLKGMGKRFGASDSLLKHGIVEKMEKGDTTYYRLSDRGKYLMDGLYKVASEEKVLKGGKERNPPVGVEAF